MNNFNVLPNDVKNIIISYSGKPIKWIVKNKEVLNNIFKMRDEYLASAEVSENVSIKDGLLISEIFLRGDYMFNNRFILTNVTIGGINIYTQGYLLNKIFKKYECNWM